MVDIRDNRSITAETYFDSLLHWVTVMRLAVNANELGDMSDVMHAQLKAKAVEVAIVSAELQQEMPALIKRLLILGLGANVEELPRALVPHFGSSGSSAAHVSTNCQKLQEEITLATDEGIGFTLAMQAQLKKECPNLQFPARAHEHPP